MDHKTIKEKLSFVKLDRTIVSIVGIALFLVVAFSVYDYFQPEWLSYQAEFRDLVEEKFGPERAEAVPSGFQQI
ncbi:MAG: hypothetical protein HW374_56, partial [Bacteroidetes bacterium]|nr:hypothetical protein [Bacteroidota bacterium]